MTRIDLDSMFTTRQVLAVLGIKSRQTLYNWTDAVPDVRLPGDTGGLLWKRSTIVRLGKAHNRTPDWDAA